MDNLSLLGYQIFVFCPEGVDSINHLLDKFNLTVAKTVLVGDVIGYSSLSAGLPTGSARLEAELLASCLECWEALLGPARQIHMDRGTHSGTKIGGAAVEVSILLTQHEVLARLSFDRVLHSLDTSGEPLEDSLHVSTLLHGDDSQLILLVNPNQEAFFPCCERFLCPRASLSPCQLLGGSCLQRQKGSDHPQAVV